ncbi:MAG TPA: hypothetical protein VMM59_00140 [Thermohalobaculum sp.]|nr:hypothetical protein [Thermohalobaculum sp.]
MLTEIEESLDARLLARLRAVPVRAGVPLLAVDADEVLVYLADHLARYLEGIGYRMRLTHYQLEGSIFAAGSDAPVPFDGCLELIDRFFEDETLNQQAVPGAAEALARLARAAQVVVLTNVPGHAGEMRRENLAALGMGYPLVVNAGGKGRALRWLAARAEAPVVFVDDSPRQHESAARRAPEVTRIHFVGASHVRRMHVDSPAAHHRVEDWADCEAVVRACLA